MFTKTSIPQYFFGDGIQPVKNDNAEDLHASEPNLSRIPSPASSVASNKKLEWDSGADIGYNVYNSFKNSRRSKSFPSLNNMDLSLSQINKSNENPDPGDEISLENKMTGDVTRENVNKNQESEKGFKHSTPNENKVLVSQISECKIDKSNVDECLQTTLTRNCSKSVQTENNIVSNKPKVNKSQQTDTLISHSTSGSSLSKSSSFQFIPGYAKSKSSENSNINTDSKISMNMNTESLKSHSDKSDVETCKLKFTEIKSDVIKTKSEQSNSSQSTEVSCSSSCPLGKMIATQQSQHLITDIDKSLHILQNFIKSKNYSCDTKKYYARKIMNKIITTKYSDDSPSNSSSESSLSKSNTDSKRSEDIQNKENTISCGVQCNTIQSHVSTETSKNAKLAETLEVIINKKAAEEAKLKNTQDKENIQSSRTVSSGVQSEQNKASRKTSKNTKLAKKLEEIINKSSKATVVLKNKSDTDLPNKNWRQPETLSEKLFEARKKSSYSSRETSTTEEFKNMDLKEHRNYILQHSKNEKKRQLLWINNEILYLHKLKELLQNNESTTNSSLVYSESKKASPVSSNSAKQPIFDVENTFLREFGSKTSPNSSRAEHLKKISIYFRGDQNKGDNNSPETQNKNSFEEPDEHDSSYRSHTHKFYEHLTKKSKKSSPKQMEKEIGKSDASIQCTLKKKKQKEYSNKSNHSRGSENVQVYYKNKLLNANSQSISGLANESESTIEYESTSEAEHYCERNSTRHPKCNTPVKPIAYYLTFNEQKLDFRRNNKTNKLQKITIKIPKLRTPEEKHSLDDSLTLQEYLMLNKPNFIQAADWRQNIISGRIKRRAKKMFTCSQMKELTTKTYRKLPEVQNKKRAYKVEDQKRYNRTMATIFSKKLQRKTLRGDVSIATCINVLSDN